MPALTPTQRAAVEAAAASLPPDRQAGFIAHATAALTNPERDAAFLRVLLREHHQRQSQAPKIPSSPEEAAGFDARFWD